jgi:hypothetical protein
MKERSQAPRSGVCQGISDAVANIAALIISADRGSTTDSRSAYRTARLRFQRADPPADDLTDTVFRSSMDSARMFSDSVTALGRGP